MGTGTGNFAVLSEHRKWRFLVFFMLYIAQGIPIGLILYALPAYFAQNGISPAVIAGFVSVCIVPHAIKLINAPIMDRWTYWPMGKRRPWVLIAQSILILVFASLALIPDPLNNIKLLMAACFMVNFFVAFQDVATDGMAVDVLPLEDQGKAAGIMFGGQIVSTAAFAALGGWGLSRYGIGIPALACSGMLVMIVVFPLISRERVGERLLPWSRGQASLVNAGVRHETIKTIAKNLKTYVLLPASLLAIVITLVISFGKGIHLALMPVYYVQSLGWTDTEFSSLTGSSFLLAGGICIVFAGPIMNWLGRRRALTMTCTLLALLGILMAFVPAINDSDAMLTAYRLSYKTFDTLGTAIFIAIAMSICTKKIAATQFALYMAMGNVGFSAGSAAFGSIQPYLSFPAVFLVYAAVMACPIIFIRRLALRHPIARFSHDD